LTCFNWAGGGLEPSVEAETALRDVVDPDRLARMIGALLDVSSWEELLATP
jgi:hypothetical protein